MQAAQRLPGTQAQATRCALLVGRDALHGGLNRVKAHRHKAHRQSRDHDGQRALEHGQGRQAQALRPGQQAAIHPGHRRKQPHRQNHAGQGVAQVGHAHQRADPALPTLAFRRARRVGQRQRSKQDHQRGEAREHQGMQHKLPVARVQVGGGHLHHPVKQLQHRRDERGREHQQASRCGGPGRRPVQGNAFARLVFGRRSELAACARTVFQPHQRQHAQRQQGRQLRGHRQIEHAQPGLVDHGGEGVDVEDRHGAKVGQHLHQRQPDACRPPRPRHGNGHAPERLAPAQAQRLRGLQALRALGLKGLARQQIHIGVKRQAKHQHRAAGGAHRWKTALQAGGRAPQRLHRPAVVHQAHMHKRQHIGRQGQRQHQRPAQPAPPREFAHHRNPGQGHAQQRHPQPNKHRQKQRVEQHPGQHIVAQVLPDFGLAQGPARPHHGQRCQRHQGQGQYDPKRPVRQSHARSYL